MSDDDFPSDSSAPVIKGTLWYPRPKALRAELSSDPVLKDNRPRANFHVEGSKTSRLYTAQPETLPETAERLRLEARQGHRKYKGPNFYSQFTRRAPETQVQAKDMKPETQVLAKNLVRMLPQKGQRKVVN